MENYSSSNGHKIIKIVVITIVVLVGLGIAGLYALRNQVYTGSLSYDGYDQTGGADVASGMPMAKNDSKMGISMPSRSAMPEVFNESTQDSTTEYAPNEVSSPTVVDKKVIKNGNLNLRVDNVDEATGEITQIAKNNGGDVFSSNVYQRGKTANTKYGTVIVKVPVNNFEKTYSELKKVANLVVSESTSGMDVTDQYVDLQAQLKNKQTEEQAFARIMEQAQKIDDILAVQRELSRVRGQIEQLQGRIKLMDSQTDMATIVVSLSEDAEIAVVDRWRPWQVAKESINALIKKVQNFVDFVIRLIITVIPVFILYGILVLVIYKIGKRIYMKFKKKEQA